ncbi:MAG: hypothetical protein GY853_15785 [PVC group bacterium]|nr:hypothetical protein [PVC group bacterium]
MKDACEVMKAGVSNMVFVMLFLIRTLERIDIRHYFKVPMGNDDDAPYKLNKEGLICLRPTQKGICMSVEDARKLVLVLEENAETLDKLNKPANLK